MTPKKPLSFQDIARRRQQSAFVGRQEQLDRFRANLSIPLEDEQRKFIFTIHGQGGVGKSTLMEQFRTLAEREGAIVARMDESQKDLLETLAEFARQFEEKEYSFKAFNERYLKYQQELKRLEADPKAPQGTLPFLARTLVKTGTRIAKHTAAGKMVFEVVDEEGFAEQVSEWATFVARKITNKDEVRLILEPVAVLTPLFLKALEKITEDHLTCLFFDTYEQTGVFLDEWLRQVLDGDHGVLSPNILLVIAGRQELNNNDWSNYEPLIAHLSLDPFTEDEAIDFLHRKGITQSDIIETILNLSGRLPVLLATLAAGKPGDGEVLIDPSNTAVERFLKWVDDPARRQLALDAAIPRYLNLDVISLLTEKENAADFFEWLKQMPFVKKQTNGWVYHEVVRTQMLRQKKQDSPLQWQKLNDILGDYYQELQDGLGLTDDNCYEDDTWQQYALESVYHHLCSKPQKRLETALGVLVELYRIKASLARAQKGSMLLEEAGNILEDEKILNVAAAWDHLLTVNDADNDPAIEAAVDRLLDIAPLNDVSSSFLYFLRGKSHYNRLAYEKALADFTRAIELEDTFKMAFAYRAASYRITKQFDLALADLQQTIKLDEKYLWAIHELGLTYLDQDKNEQAMVEFSRVIELDKNYKWAFANRALLHRNNNDYDASLQDLNHALKVDPNYTYACHGRGLTYLEMEDYPAALRDFDLTIYLDPGYKAAYVNRGRVKRLLKDYKASIEDYNSALRLQSDYTNAFNGRGLAYHSLKQYKEAHRDFTRVLEIDPKHKWALVNRGENFRMLKDFNAALQDYNDVIAIDPDYDYALAGRGYVHRALNQLEDALKDFDNALKIDPDYLWALNGRGLVHQGMEKYEEALKDFSKAIELDSTYQYAFTNRGETYRLLSRHEEALADFKSALDIDPDFADAYNNRGLVHETLEAYQDAIKDYNKAISLDDEYQWAYYNRANAYMYLGDFQRSLTDLNKAIEIDPTYDYAITIRGRIKRFMGDLDAALADIEEALKISPKNDWIIEQRAEVLCLSGKHQEAIDDLDICIKAAPKDDWYYYYRFLAYSAMKNQDAAKADIKKAIELSKKQKYNDVAQKWRNHFNKALYDLADGKHTSAEKQYLASIEEGASRERISEAIIDLKEFRSIFPKDKNTNKIIDLLQTHFNARAKNE